MSAVEVKDKEESATVAETPAVAVSLKKLVLADSHGHIMVHVEDVGDDWVCQKCNKASKNGGYSCTKNDAVRLCDECAVQMSKNMICGKPERHVLNGYLHDDLCKIHPEYLEGYACDECCEFGPFEAIFHCEECEYDLCPSCAGALMFGTKKAETNKLPGSSLEAMLKMMSPEDIEKCCKNLPDDLRKETTATTTAAGGKPKPKKKSQKPKGKQGKGKKKKLY